MTNTLAAIYAGMILGIAVCLAGVLVTNKVTSGSWLGE